MPRSSDLPLPIDRAQPYNRPPNAPSHTWGGRSSIASPTQLHWNAYHPDPAAPLLEESSRSTGAITTCNNSPSSNGNPARRTPPCDDWDPSMHDDRANDEMDGDWFTVGEVANRLPEASPDEENYGARTGTGSDFPTVFTVRQIVWEHLSRLGGKKREKQLFSQSMYATIVDAIVHPNRPKTRPQSFYNWANANFRVASFQGHEALCQNGKPVLARDAVYDVLCHAHHESDHGGRDKTSEHYYTMLPKEIITAFVAACPKCQRQKTKIITDRTESQTFLLGLQTTVEEDEARLARGESISLEAMMRIAAKSGWVPTASRPKVRGKTTKGQTAKLAQAGCSRQNAPLPHKAAAEIPVFALADVPPVPTPIVQQYTPGGFALEIPGPATIPQYEALPPTSSVFCMQTNPNPVPGPLVTATGPVDIPYTPGGFILDLPVPTSFPSHYSQTTGLPVPSALGHGGPQPYQRGGYILDLSASTSSSRPNGSGPFPESTAPSTFVQPPSAYKTVPDSALPVHPADWDHVNSTPLTKVDVQIPPTTGNAIDIELLTTRQTFSRPSDIPSRIVSEPFIDYAEAFSDLVSGTRLRTHPGHPGFQR